MEETPSPLPSLHSDHPDTRTLEDRFLTLNVADHKSICQYIQENHKDVEITRLIPRELYSFTVPGFDNVIFYEINYAWEAFNPQSNFSQDDYINQCCEKVNLVKLVKLVKFDDPRVYFKYVGLYKDSQLVLPVEQLDASLLAQVDELHMEEAKNAFGSYARPLEEHFVSLSPEDIQKIDAYLNNKYHRVPIWAIEPEELYVIRVPGFNDITLYGLDYALQNLNIYSKVSRKDFQEHCQFVANAVSLNVAYPPYIFLYVALVGSSPLITSG